MQIAYAGDRDLSVWVLKFIVGQGIIPRALLVSDETKATHAEELMALCPTIPPRYIMKGGQFAETEHLELLSELELDYIICVHFPYLVPARVLAIPKIGVLNLHPAYLPYNRGWHTPTWAILESTPYGATLHFMDESLDTGDIIHQREIAVKPGDTADSLYQRVKHLEYEVFRDAWPQLVTGDFPRIPHKHLPGTMHKRKELFTEAVQRIQLEETMPAVELLRRLRALTTNSLSEAAYYEVNGKRYRIQVKIEEENGDL